MIAMLYLSSTIICVILKNMHDELYEEIWYCKSLNIYYYYYQSKRSCFVRKRKRSYATSKIHTNQNILVLLPNLYNLMLMLLKEWSVIHQNFCRRSSRNMSGHRQLIYTCRDPTDTVLLASPPTRFVNCKRCIVQCSKPHPR